jgi:tyrosyl-tRNA synthetase
VGADIPVFKLAASDLGKGMAVYELMRQSGLCDSGGEAKRLIRGGGGRINDQKIEDENQTIDQALFKGSDGIKLSAGKKKHVLVKLA